MRAAFALQLLVAACALCAPQQFTTDSNLEQFPTVINPSQTSLFPDPPFTIPLPPGQTFPFPSGSSGTASVTYPIEPPETPSRTNTPPSVTPTTTPSLTASQSLPTNPTIPVTLEPSPTETGTGAALTIRAQPVAVLILVAGVSAALL